MRKQILNTPLAETSAAVSNRVNVSNVQELYDAINDTANSGKTIVMAPGTYNLRPDFPDGGQLKLQHDMSLKGQDGHPESVIIDASALDANSAPFAIPQSPGNPFNLRKSVVRMGNGENTIEWMTLQNDPNQGIRSLIQTDIIATTFTKVRIAHTIIKSSNIGVNIINWRTDSNARTVEAEIENNDITIDNINPDNTFGSAIQIQNSHAVSGAVINATLRGNHLHGSKSGISVFNGQAAQNSITVRSNADRIENNGVGLNFRAGLSTNRPDFPGNNNSILFEAHGTAIRNNSGTPTPTENSLAGGVFATAGYVPANGTVTANNNTLELRFHGSPIEGNTNGDQINVFGAYSPPPSITPAGSNNTTELHLHGVSRQATVNPVNSFPDEPAGTNTVNIFR